MCEVYESICDYCERGDTDECECCCAKCIEDFGYCPYPDVCNLSEEE